MSLQGVGLENIKIKKIATDLLLAPGVPDAPVGDDAAPWAPVFCPRIFVRTHKQISTDDFSLEPAVLQKLGAQVTELRSRFLKEAAAE